VATVVVTEVETEAVTEVAIEVVTGIEAQPAEETDTMTDVTTVEAEVTDEKVGVHHDDEVGRHPGEGRQVPRDEGTIMVINEGAVMTDEAEMIDGMIDETIMTGGIEDRRNNGKKWKKWKNGKNGKKLKND